MKNNLIIKLILTLTVISGTGISGENLGTGTLPAHMELQALSFENRTIVSQLSLYNREPVTIETGPRESQPRVCNLETSERGIKYKASGRIDMDGTSYQVKALCHAETSGNTILQAKGDGKTMKLVGSFKENGSGLQTFEGHITVDSERFTLSGSHQLENEGESD